MLKESVLGSERKSGFGVWAVLVRKVAWVLVKKFLNGLGYACSGVGDTSTYVLLRNYYSSEMLAV